MKLINENGKEETHRVVARPHFTAPNQLKVYLVLDPHDDARLGVIAEATFQFDNPVALAELARQCANLIPRVLKQAAQPPPIVTASAELAEKLKQRPQ